MGRRATIYLMRDVDHTLAQLDGKAGISALIRRIVGRYDAICRRHLPAFSNADWTFLFRPLRRLVHIDPESIAVLESRIRDVLATERVITSHAAEALLQRLGDLCYAGRVAILDAAERYWSALERGEQPPLPSIDEEAPTTTP